VAYVGLRCLLVVRADEESVNDYASDENIAQEIEETA
jgi:hypothetical protein